MKKIISISLAILMLLAIFCLPANAASAPFSVPKGFAYNAKTKTLSGKETKEFGDPHSFYLKNKGLDYSINWISDPIQKNNVKLLNNVYYSWALADPIKNGQIKSVIIKDKDDSNRNLCYEIERNKKGQVTSIQQTREIMYYPGADFEYNSKGQISYMFVHGSNGPGMLCHFSYNPSGQLISIKEGETGGLDDKEFWKGTEETSQFTYKRNHVIETIQNSEGTKTVTHNL